MKEMYVYGEKMPQEEYNELVAEYGEDMLSQEFLETLYYYDWRDCQEM